MIRCRKCGEEKPEDDFGLDARRKSGKSAWCHTCANAHSRAYNKENRDKISTKYKRWYEKHKERDAERYRQKAKLWYRNNPEKAKEYRQDRKAVNKLKREDLFVEHVSLRLVYTRDEGVCHLCEGYVEWKDATCDHIIPLADGGEHSYKNVKLAHHYCNSARVRMPVDLAKAFIQSKVRANSLQCTTTAVETHDPYSS